MDPMLLVLMALAVVLSVVLGEEEEDNGEWRVEGEGVASLFPFSSVDVAVGAVGAEILVVAVAVVVVAVVVVGGEPGVASPKSVQPFSPIFQHLLWFVEEFCSYFMR